MSTKPSCEESSFMIPLFFTFGNFYSVVDLEIFEGVSVYKTFALFNVQTKKNGLSNIEVTFVAFLNQNIVLSVLSDLLNPFT